jgi:hypothetical protein
MPTSVVCLYTENLPNKRQRPWRTAYLREAVRLDSKFALGWALSYVDARGYITQVFNQRLPCVKRRGRQPKPRSSSAHPWRGRTGQGSLPLLDSKRLRHRSALL